MSVEQVSQKQLGISWPLHGESHSVGRQSGTHLRGPVLRWTRVARARPVRHCSPRSTVAERVSMGRHGSSRSQWPQGGVSIAADTQCAPVSPQTSHGSRLQARRIQAAAHRPTSLAISCQEYLRITRPTVTVSFHLMSFEVFGGASQPNCEMADWAELQEAAAAATHDPTARLQLAQTLATTSTDLRSLSTLFDRAAEATAGLSDHRGRGKGGSTESEAAATEAILSAVSLAVSAGCAPFLLGLAKSLNETRRDTGGGESDGGGRVPWRMAVLRRILEDAGSADPPFVSLTDLCNLCPELAHECLVWLAVEGRGGCGLHLLPPPLRSVIAQWIGRKPGLLLPLIIGSDTDNGRAGRQDNVEDVFGLELACRVGHAAATELIELSAAGTAACPAVELHEAVIAALSASLGDPLTVLTMLEEGVPAGRPEVSRRVGALQWPSRLHAEFIADLTESAPRSRSLGRADGRTVWDLVEVPIASALALGAVCPTGAQAMGAALARSLGDEDAPPFTAYVLAQLESCAAGQS